MIAIRTRLGFRLHCALIVRDRGRYCYLLVRLPYLRKSYYKCFGGSSSPFRVTFQLTTAHNAKPEERPTTTETRQTRHATAPLSGAYKMAQISLDPGYHHQHREPLRDVIGSFP